MALMLEVHRLGSMAADMLIRIEDRCVLDEVRGLVDCVGPRIDPLRGARSSSPRSRWEYQVKGNES